MDGPEWVKWAADTFRQTANLIEKGEVVLTHVNIEYETEYQHITLELEGNPHAMGMADRPTQKVLR